MTDTRVVVVMPAYNEAEGLPGFIDDIRDAASAAGRTVRFAIVDDRSTDGTAEAVRALGDDTVTVVTADENRGHGPTALASYRLGLGEGADVIVHVDGDGQFHGRDIVRVIAALESSGADCVHGVRHDRTDPWFRRAISLILRFAVLVIARRPIPDINTPLRAYRPAALRRLLDDVPADALVPHVHFSIAESAHGFSVEHVAVTSIPRRGTGPTGTMWGGGRSRLLPSSRLVRFVAGALGELWRVDITPVWTRPRTTWVGLVPPLVVALAVVVVAYLPLAVAGVITRDSGVFTYTGRVMVMGGMPYVDSWDHKGPITYLVNALAWSTGLGIRGVIVLEALWLLAGLVALAAIWRRVLGAAPICIGIVLVGASYVGTYEGGNFTETWLFPLQLVAYSLTAVALLRRGRTLPPGPAVGLGVVLGLAAAFAALTRVNNGIGIGVVILVLLVRIRRPARIRFAIALVATGAAIVAPVLVWLGARHALPAMIDEYVGYSVAYSAQDVGTRAGAISTFVQSLIFTPSGIAGIAVLTAVVVVGGVRRRLAARDGAGLAGSTVFAVIALAFLADAASQLVAHRAYVHYAVTALAALAVLPLIAWSGNRGVAPTRPDRKALASSAVAVLALAVVFGSTGVAAYDRVRAMLSNGVFVAGSYQNAIVDYVDAHTDADQRVLVHGAETWILSAADRTSVTPITYLLPVAVGYGDLPERYRRDIEADPPALIVEAPDVCGISAPCPPDQAYFGGLNTFVAAHYTIDADIDGFRFWLPTGR
ncbi:glycosyltransferase family 2 protein [Galbitalea sp. SE-J8]|uniref:glycosyltransferase family 2 protein n=1 Tax=Galbitalea sp. SE-J8 TaxID=3054952 RepID=UPI00259D1994|nr:glycosyltransferase family 2 protein [Galbitalea sp. SE-J8]MDM4761501.1 glycosyltransferase family 2 protein [Galbitalea sp. SE-J8]